MFLEHQISKISEGSWHLRLE